MPNVIMALRSVLQNVQSVSATLAVSLLTVCVCGCVGYRWQDMLTESLCVSGTGGRIC